MHVASGNLYLLQTFNASFSLATTLFLPSFFPLSSSRSVLPIEPYFCIVITGHGSPRYHGLDLIYAVRLFYLLIRLVTHYSGPSRGSTLLPERPLSDRSISMGHTVRALFCFSDSKGIPLCWQSGASEIPGIDRSLRDTAFMLALFRGFSGPLRSPLLQALSPPSLWPRIILEIQCSPFV